jgi:hypothetical protein
LSSRETAIRDAFRGVTSLVVGFGVLGVEATSVAGSGAAACAGVVDLPRIEFQSFRSVILPLAECRQRNPSTPTIHTAIGFIRRLSTPSSKEFEGSVIGFGLVTFDDCDL